MNQHGTHCLLHRNPMKLSLIKAAEVSGKSKSTINRAIKSGKLSAQRNEDGSYNIDPSELERAFPKSNHGTPTTEPATNPVELLQFKVLEAKLEATTERLRDASERLMEKDDIISDLRSDRDTWRQQATRLLGDHGEGNIKDAKGFWKRLLG